MNPPDRRRYPRHSIVRPAKLRCDQTGSRALSGQTHNISPEGALVHVHHPVALRTGQRVRLLVAQDPRQALLSAADQREGTIVRSINHPHGQDVAIRLNQPQILTDAG